MKNLPQILIGIGMVFTFLGGFLAFKRQSEFRIGQEKLAKDNKHLSKTNIELTKSNENLISKNVVLTEKSQELIDENIAITKGNKELAELNLGLGTKTKELAQKNLELTDNVKQFTTGSEKILLIDFREDFQNYTDKIALMAMNQDRVPIFDLKMIITEMYTMTIQENEEWIKESAEQYKKTGKPIPLKNKRHDVKLGVFQPQSYWTFGYLPIPMQNNIGHYKITVYTRARIYYMNTYVKKSNQDKWVSHSEYYEDLSNKNLITTHTMRDYPKLTNGTPDKRLK